jgi:DNA segregation ATPase FtsK/SpoIIIE-like protein
VPKKLVSKKTTKAKSDTQEVETEVQSSWGYKREIGGWTLILISVLCLLSLVSNFIPVEENLLGPYLGIWLANFLMRAVGRLPVLLFIAAILLTGMRVLKLYQNSGKHGVALLNYGILFSLILSIDHLAKTAFVLEDFEASGGVLGNFLVRFIFSPLFGVSTLGPYILVGAGLYFLSLWYTGYKPSEMLRNWIKKKREAHIPGTGWIRKSPLTPAQELIKRKREAEEKESQQNEITPSKKPVKPKKIAPEMAKKSSLFENDTVESMSLKATESELNPIDEFEFDPDNPPSKPLELRKWRDKKADLERVKEMNEWEDRQDGALNIDGILSNQEEESVKAPTQETPVVEAPIIETPDENLPISKKKTQVMPKIGAGDSDPSANPKPSDVFEAYKVPEVDAVFEEVPAQVLDFDEHALHQQSELLENQLSNFRVKGKVLHITTGPVITRFEIDLAPGVKVAKVASLSEDLALALKAKSVRILAPIPGKSAVGIEIPNPKSHIVYCKDILEHKIFKDSDKLIPIALGKDIGGLPYVMDLGRAPHLLIAGQTGSGKSVCINTIMASILCSQSPEDLRMILVDPKVVELKPYESIPHLLAPVVTNPEIAVQALKWACWEMDRRYEVLANAKVRNLEGFNKKFAANKLVDLVDPEDHKKMPFIIIIIDELADLMMVAGKEVEVSIARIAQKARAVGIHLILATQRPSTNVITGTIKANLPTRIAFKVASQIDARTIMDKMGAEKLLGRGDMLFKSISDEAAVRIHGAFVTDEEAEVMADNCANQNVNYPMLTSFDFEGDESSDEREVGPRDDKFHEAAELVVHVGSASASALQRRLGVGYARAGRLIDQLEAAGIVGKSKGSKPRDVLMSEEELDSFLSGDVDYIDL